MEKLTLEHLAPYLPYKPKVQTEDGIYDVEGWSNDIGIMLNTIDYGFNAVPACKLVLRPISDVKTTIETKDGPKNFASLLDLSQDEDGDWCERVYADQCESPSVLSVITGFNWWLFEYHFDVFGLIEKGLAISIHDVKEGV